MLFSKDKSRIKPNGEKIADCKKCNAPIGDQHSYSWCTECGEALSEEIINLIPNLVQKRVLAQKTEQEKSFEQQRLHSQIESVILTTAHSLENHKILHTLDILTAEVVIGLNILNTIVLGLETDFVSGQDASTNKLLKDARKSCLFELKKEANSINANAVIGVCFNYTELPFGGKKMLLLVASGTAVKVETIEFSQQISA